MLPASWTEGNTASSQRQKGDAMIDYAEIVNVLQKGLAEGYASNLGLLNTPGSSLACKIDPFYYLAAYPAFKNYFVKACGLLPSKIEEALIKSGELVTNKADREPLIHLKVLWPSRRGVVQRGGLDAAFVNADFIDRGLALYAKTPGLGVSALKLDEREQPRIPDVVLIGNARVDYLWRG
jgi:hypothetical protein